MIGLKVKPFWKLVFYKKEIFGSFSMKEENELTRRLYGTHDGHRKLQPSSLSKSFVPKKKGLRKSSSTLLPSLPKKEYTTSLTTSASAQALFDDSIQVHLFIHDVSE